MKIVYMGTPDFAVNTLECLLNSEHDVCAVFTQPDKPQGRKQLLTPPPVKEIALKYSVPVYQPVKIREKEYVELLKKLSPDVAVVAAFGQILPKEILDIPKFGCINVHASLLPRYRGAAPIQWSIINGDEETGVTIMQMNEGIDTGDIIIQEKLRLAEDEIADTLFGKLANLGGPLVLKTLKLLEEGKAEFTKQDEAMSSTVRMLKKEDGRINWNDSAIKIERLVRGLNSWPCAFSVLDGITVKIWRCKAVDSNRHDLKPGQVFVADGNMLVSCKEGSLMIYELQLAGKKRMQAADFVRGYREIDNKILG